jgi:cytidylate kinase
MIIAIDGSAASGKGTLAKQLAEHLGYDYLDTGTLYRAVALSLLNDGIDEKNISESQAVKCASTLCLTLTNNPIIRSDAVANLASKVAVLESVRTKLLKLQRDFAEAPPSGKGAVLDGRDIGTIVLPNANLKFFVDADINIRAHRRTKELRQSGQSAMFRDVLADLKTRDERDRTRVASPMRAADDAITIDTSKLDASSVLALALAHISSAKIG